MPETDTEPVPIVKVPEKIAPMPLPLLEMVAEAAASEIALDSASDEAVPVTDQWVESV